MGANILAIDQGTTGSTAIVMSEAGRTLARANREFPQHFPSPGRVEHEPDEIWASVEYASVEAVRRAGIEPADIAAVGITNQRETTLLWERSSGRPLGRAIVWQDRRTAPLCAALREAGHEQKVRAVTGLVLDPYFSGTKARWLLDEIAGARARAERGELCLGTVDSYLVYRLAGGGGAAPHVTDVTNASRTLLMDLRQLSWSQPMAELLEVPLAALPEIRPSAGLLGRTKGFAAVRDGTPITGMAGDQHAALFGQGCFTSGDVKCTYGTGAFVLVNTGGQALVSRSGLLSTVAWQIGDEVCYALEGSCFVAGAAVQWLRDGLGIIASSADIEALAASVESSEGVVFVPALAGLGAPHWDPDARGLVAGLTRGSTRGHLARATLEAIAFQVDELLRAMGQDLGSALGRMRVDGGAAANSLLMQIQADISGISVDRPGDLESTGRGAAMLAGVGAGIFDSPRSAASMIQIERSFDVKMGQTERAAERRRWALAVARARLKDSAGE
jgi:glycerol kinase